MGSYRAADNPDRVKAAAAVALVHVGLAALVLSGLTVSTIAHKTEALKVFDISDDVPPPVEPTPPPEPDESSAPKDQPAPENIRSTPTEVVAPRQVSLPVPLPMSAALAPGQGSDSSAGAGANPGAGSGAGGQGSGTGGGGSGGSGTGDGRSPAFPLNKIPNRDYRRIAAGRLPSGSASMSFVVTSAGRVTDCRIVASSGDQAVDATLCPLAEQRLRFRPAMDAQRRPIAYKVGRYVVTWDLD